MQHPSHSTRCRWRSRRPQGSLAREEVTGKRSIFQSLSPACPFRQRRAAGARAVSQGVVRAGTAEQALGSEVETKIETLVSLRERHGSGPAPAHLRAPARETDVSCFSRICTCMCPQAIYTHYIDINSFYTDIGVCGFKFQYLRSPWQPLGAGSLFQTGCEAQDKRVGKALRSTRHGAASRQGGGEPCLPAGLQPSPTCLSRGYRRTTHIRNPGLLW